MCVTLGPAGAALVAGDAGAALVPAVPASAGDPCGAGDSSPPPRPAPWPAARCPAKRSPRRPARAGEFLAAGGAAAITPGRRPGRRLPLTRQEPGSPTVESLLDAVRRPAASSSPPVAASTCCTPGMSPRSKSARALGDCLVVCLNSDASVRRLKGAGRPLQSAADRAGCSPGWPAVDAVVVFDEDTPARCCAGSVRTSGSRAATTPASNCPRRVSR